MIDPLQLVAHRGLQSNYPENTLIAITKAIEAGARFIEIDLQYSKDRLPVISHDDNLNRVGANANFHFHNRNRKEIINQAAHEPGRFGDKFIEEKIPKLEDILSVLNNHPEVTFFVELKQETLHQKDFQNSLNTLSEILKNVIEKVVVISFDLELIHFISRNYNFRRGIVLTHFGDLDLDKIELIKPEFIFLDFNLIPSNFILSEHPIAKMTQFVCYEVDNSELATNLLDRGVNMIETFNFENLCGS
tara:strand:- start:605 stop:1345 length:741 start_codon:yes stop_codon:yes gene_type:complete